MSAQPTPPPAALARLARSRNRLSLALIRLQTAQHSKTRGSAKPGSMRDALGSLALSGMLALCKRWGWIAVPTLIELVVRWLAAQEPDKPSA